MRLELADDFTLRLVVSRRNLLSLLAKLDGNPPNSVCTLVGGSEASGIAIHAEEDDVHYAHRPAGAMHPATESHTTLPVTGIE